MIYSSLFLFYVGVSTKLVVSDNNFTVHSGMGRKRSDDKKTCRWVLDNGTICGRSFSKFDSLRRHVQELHKGIYCEPIE